MFDKNAIKVCAFLYMRFRVSKSFAPVRFGSRDIKKLGFTDFAACEDFLQGLVKTGGVVSFPGGFYQVAGYPNDYRIYRYGTPKLSDVQTLADPSTNEGVPESDPLSQASIGGNSMSLSVDETYLGKCFGKFSGRVWDISDLNKVGLIPEGVSPLSAGVQIRTLCQDNKADELRRGRYRLKMHTREEFDGKLRYSYQLTDLWARRPCKVPDTTPKPVIPPNGVPTKTPQLVLPIAPVKISSQGLRDLALVLEKQESLETEMLSVVEEVNSLKQKSEELYQKWCAVSKERTRLQQGIVQAESDFCTHPVFPQVLALIVDGIPKVPDSKWVVLPKSLQELEDTLAQWQSEGKPKPSQNREGTVILQGRKFTYQQVYSAVFTNQKLPWLNNVLTRLWGQ